MAVVGGTANAVGDRVEKLINLSAMRDLLVSVETRFQEAENRFCEAAPKTSEAFHCYLDVEALQNERARIIFEALYAAGLMDGITVAQAMRDVGDLEPEALAIVAGIFDGK